MSVQNIQNLQFSEKEVQILQGATTKLINDQNFVDINLMLKILLNHRKDQSNPSVVKILKLIQSKYPQGINQEEFILKLQDQLFALTSEKERHNFLHEQ